MARFGFKCKFYPNGEWTAGYVPPKRLRKEDYPDIPPHTDEPMAPIDLYDTCVKVLRAEEQAKLATLGLSVPANYHKPRGLNGITSRGQRLVRNAAYALQARYGRSRLSFLTLTLPRMDSEVEKEVCEKWSQIVRVFCQRLKRNLEACQLPSSYVGVTEVQTKRWHQFKQVGLHLHLVFVGRDAPPSHWKLKPSDVRSWWLEVLSSCLKRPMQSTACENLQMVRKDASGYLGKYMSKGVEIIGEITEERGEDWCPPSWYTCSMDLKKCVARSVVECWDEDIHLIMRLPLLCQAEIVKNVYVNSIRIDNKSFVVGFGGKFAKDKLLIRHGEIYRARAESYRRAVNYWDT